jgi:hypothetical protein
LNQSAEPTVRRQQKQQNGSGPGNCQNRNIDVWKRQQVAFGLEFDFGGSDWGKSGYQNGQERNY